MIALGASLIIAGSSLLLSLEPQVNLVSRDDRAYTTQTTTVESWVASGPPVLTTTTTTLSKPPSTLSSSTKPSWGLAPAVSAVQPAPTNFPQVIQEGDWVMPSDCTAGGKKSRAHALHCWGGLIARYDWPHAKVFDVLYCESNGNADAIGPRDSKGLYPTGLMQIKAGTTDPVANIRQAHQMWLARKWQPWACA